MCYFIDIIAFSSVFDKIMFVSTHTKYKKYVYKLIID